MAPEQAAGDLDRIDRRTDVYGLGAILYEILTGEPPFSGPTTAEVLRRVREEEPAPPRRVCASAPPALEAVCLKALSKAPGRRYAAVEDLAREVQRYLADEPVAAYREPWGVRLARRVRRHRSAALAAAGAMAAVTLISITAALLVNGAPAAGAERAPQGRAARRRPGRRPGPGAVRGRRGRPRAALAGAQPGDGHAGAGRHPPAGHPGQT
jgi:serine/threonine-protein kinase